jgi:hypothetical protein
MKKKKIIITALLSLLAVIVIVFAALCIKYNGIANLVFNWDNIVSFVNSQRYSTKQLEDKMASNKAKMDKIAEDDPNINIRGDLTEEESKALSEGKITREEAVSIVKGDTTLEKVLASKENSAPKDEKEPQKPETNNGKEDKPKEPEATKPKEDTPPKEESPKDRVSEIIAELYVIQADFIAQLEAVGDQAYADYKAIRYKRDQIPAIVDSYTGTVSVMERQCDEKVASLLKELEAELIKVNGDLNTVKEIKKYYYNEKSLKKSYYLNKMNDEDYK